jgi:hypothetical protein
VHSSSLSRRRRQLPDEVGATDGVRKNKVVTATSNGLDASLLLTNETLRPENAYDR